MPVQTTLFQVYLRLRPVLQNQPPKSEEPEPWLLVEPPSLPTTSAEERSKASVSTHVTLQPPNDSRKRAVERFGFTKVFEGDSTQLDIFESTGTVQLVHNILRNGRDGLVATLGVTGSGKVRSRSRLFRRWLLTVIRVIQSSDLVRNAASHKCLWMPYFAQLVLGSVFQIPVETPTCSPPFNHPTRPKPKFCPRTPSSKSFTVTMKGAEAQGRQHQ